MRRSVAALVVALCASGLGLKPSVANEYPRADGQAEFARQALDAHNRERRSLGLPPLRWNPIVAAHAQSWADEMARSGRYLHSPRESRSGEGENMVRHIAGAYSPAMLVGTFLSERQVFMPGIFPAVSRTGNWKDAGHYSQVIWPETSELGCGMATRRGVDYFVCRYFPAGNVLGEKVG